MDSDKKLKVFRDKIDEIDNSIVELIKQRMLVVKEVGRHKESNNDKFFIRSAREADMMKDLTGKLEGVLDKRAVFNIWRSLIVSANVSEQGLEVFYYNQNNDLEAKKSLQDYYANLIKITDIENIKQFLLESDNKNARILAVDSSDVDVFETILQEDKNLKIFAKVGKLYLLANKPVEKSQEDKLIFVVDGIIVESDIEVEGEFLGVVSVG